MPLAEIPPVHLSREWSRSWGRARAAQHQDAPMALARGVGAPTAPRAPGRRHPPSPGTAPASRQPGAMLFWRPRCDRAVTSAVRGGIPAIRENQEGGKHAS